MDEPSKLMERIRARDVRAFEELYDRYHRLVFGVALRVLSDPGLAEDVTQAVFLKIWNSADAFYNGNFGAWIVRVARNRAFDQLRARTVRSETVFPAAMPANDALEDTALEHVDAGLVREALARLPAEQRELIELGFFGGSTHEEIAHHLSMPLGTVKSRIRAGLRRLRSALEMAVTA